MHAPDEPLDGVPIIIQDENYRGQLVGDHCRQLLGSKLPKKSSQQSMRPGHQHMHSQTSISDEKNGPPQLAIPSTTCRTQKSTDAITNTTPQDLCDKRGSLGQGYVDDTETRSSGLS